MESLIALVKHNGPCDNISAPSGTLDHRQKETTMPVTVILELTLTPESVPAARDVMRRALQDTRAFDGNLDTDRGLPQLSGRRRSANRAAFAARRAPRQNEVQHYRRLIASVIPRGRDEFQTRASRRRRVAPIKYQKGGRAKGAAAEIDAGLALNARLASRYVSIGP
jgi:hypothetical protein